MKKRCEGQKDKNFAKSPAGENQKPRGVLEEATQQRGTTPTPTKSTDIDWGETEKHQQGGQLPHKPSLYGKGTS